MRRDTLPDLSLFLTVVEEGSFTRAAARLGTSQSAVSLGIRRLEESLGLRLLNRTTRQVAPTAAGERLAQSLAPSFAEIAAQVAAAAALRDQPGGLVRINCPAHAAETVLWPRLSTLMAQHPGLEIELTVEGRFTDIVAGRFDAGVRLGESLDQDMIAARIGPDLRMGVVAAPAFLARAGEITHPRDLVRHDCINLRLETKGGLYAWEFTQGLTVRVTGRLAFNTSALCRTAALEGHGLAYLPEDQTAPFVESGQLVRVLPTWSPSFAGYHIYYPSRRQTPPALALVIEHLRWRGAQTV
jgi:DNA-binding transcriptional LysR family regulator